MSAGRRLDFVRAFTRQRDFPDLTALVVNKTTGECGIGFTRSFDPEDARTRVLAFNWEGVSEEFSGAVMEAMRQNSARQGNVKATNDL